MVLCLKWTYFKYMICEGTDRRGRRSLREMTPWVGRDWRCCMADYREMYRLMARTAEYAARELEKGNSGLALLALRVAQARCEEIYLQSSDEEQNYDLQ